MLVFVSFFFSSFFVQFSYLVYFYLLIWVLINTYTPFDFNQSTINSNNTLLNDVDPSNFNLDLTIDSNYYTSDELNLNHKSIFQHGLDI